MRLFLESAALDAIRWALDARLIDGVFVTPGALDADAYGIEVTRQVESISRVATTPILVTVGAIAADDLEKQGRELAKVADNVVAAIPFVEDGIAALRRLISQGIRTAATCIVTPGQALLAAKTGAAYVCVEAEQMDAHGHDPAEALREIRALFDRHGIECDVVAHATRSARLVTGSLVAGADAVAVTNETLRGLMQHPLTDRLLDQMLGEISRRPRTHPR